MWQNLKMQVVCEVVHITNRLMTNFHSLNGHANNYIIALKHLWLFFIRVICKASPFLWALISPAIPFDETLPNLLFYIKKGPKKEREKKETKRQGPKSTCMKHDGANPIKLQA
jgi:hypothetical protein